MPYADVQRRRDAISSWRAAHPDEVRRYRRSSFVNRAIKERRIPRAAAILHHGLTNDEVHLIVTAALG
jgi:hypothetical protein